MSIIQGTRYSDTDTYNIGIDMSGTLDMMSPFDVPLLQLIGKDSLSNPCVAVKHEWLEDELRSLNTALATQGEFSGTGAISTSTVTAGDGELLRAGDVVMIESELILITATPATDDILTATRAYGGSTAAAHVTLTPMYIIGNVNTQTAAVAAARSTIKSTKVNYTQIFQDSITVSSTLQAIKKYVEQDEMSAGLERALKLAWIQMERTLLHGKYVAPTYAVAGAMDGILPKITTNAYAKGGLALTEEYVLQALQDCWTYGGQPSHVFVNAFQKRQMNKFLDSMRMTTRTDRIAGAVVDTYSSDFGTVNIVLDRNMPTDTVLFIDAKRIGFGPLTDHALKVIDIPATTGLVATKQLYGQYTSETRQQKAHAKITGLSTS
jgi:hypothetical protein